MEEDIYSPPNSRLGIDNIEDGALASRWKRFWAALIDTLTIIPFTIPLMYFTGGFDGMSKGIQPSLSYTLIMAIVGAVIFLLIHGKIIVRDGQTWGKKAQAIKIVTTGGQHPSVQILAKRYGFFWCAPQIPVVGPFVNIINILFIFSKSKRCIHDHIAGTKVVEANK